MAENQVGAVRGTAQEEGTAVAQHARQAAGEVGATAREQAGQVADEAKGQAKHVMQDMKQRVSGEAEQQAHKVSEQINRIADELTTMADGSGPDSMTAGALRQVADTGRQAARYLDERGARGLFDSAQDFARRKPGTFLIGAAVAGFLVTRVAKSVGAPDERPEQEYYRTPQPRQPHDWRAQPPQYRDRPGYEPVTAPMPEYREPAPEYSTLAPQIPAEPRPYQQPGGPYQTGGSPNVQR